MPSTPSYTIFISMTNLVSLGEEFPHLNARDFNALQSTSRNLQKQHFRALRHDRLELLMEIFKTSLALQKLKILKAA